MLLTPTFNCVKSSCLLINILKCICLNFNIGRIPKNLGFLFDHRRLFLKSVLWRRNNCAYFLKGLYLQILIIGWIKLRPICWRYFRNLLFPSWAILNRWFLFIECNLGILVTWIVRTSHLRRWFPSLILGIDLSGRDVIQMELWNHMHWFFNIRFNHWGFLTYC